ncbi:MAG: hypothetical protein LHV68_04075 [Elusimicrobia bacterium]|nr:hypothetical protein [Candidatus Liberimonas magnetica]
MVGRISQALLKEITIRNLKDSIEVLSVALDHFRNEDFTSEWKDMDEMLRKIERDARVTRLILQ